MSSKRPRRERNKADKKERIRVAALELFSEVGFEATTTKAVAERAGVAAGTVFLYAEDKHDLLFLALHDELERIVSQQLASLPDGPLLDRLLHIFKGPFAFYEQHPKVARAFVQASLVSQGPHSLRVDTLTMQTVGRIAQVIEQAAASGEIAPDVPAMLAAQNCFALYTGALLAWLRGLVPSVPIALDPLLRMALELQIRGLGPPPTR